MAKNGIDACAHLQTSRQTEKDQRKLDSVFPFFQVIVYCLHFDFCMLNIEMLSCKSTTNKSSHSLSAFILVTANGKTNVFVAKRGEKIINMVSGAIN